MIRALRKEKDMWLRELTKSAKMPLGYLAELEARKKKPHRSTC
jgi:hypothetical protein